MSEFKVGDKVICNDYNHTNVIGVVIDTDFSIGCTVKIGYPFKYYFLLSELRLATELEAALYE